MNQNRKSKSTIVINLIISKIQIIVGSILTLLFGLTLIVGLFDDVSGEISMITVFFILTALSIYLLLRGIKRGKLIKLFRIYGLRLSTDSNCSMDQLAVSLGTSVDVVIKNVEEMIKRGYFTNAYIDTTSNDIVFTGQASTKTTDSKISNLYNTQNANVEYTTVSCRGCGAINKIIKGTVSECEFCGSQTN